MELMEIISDALVYPLHNIKALVIYLILGIILGLCVAGTVAAIAAGAAVKNIFAVLGTGIIGIIIAVVLGFLISGFTLDIVKFGINRDSGSPGIDFLRQFINGFKLFVVEIVYFIIPIIMAAILAIVFQHWLAVLIEFVLFVIFALAAFMAQCRLAKTEDLGYALAIGEAIGDMSRVGILKLIGLIILIFLVAFILYFIAGMIAQWNGTIGGILMGIVGVYIVFFESRACGLLYSDV